MRIGAPCNLRLASAVLVAFVAAVSATALAAAPPSFVGPTSRIPLDPCGSEDAITVTGSFQVGDDEPAPVFTFGAALNATTIAPTRLTATAVTFLAPPYWMVGPGVQGRLWVPLNVTTEAGRASVKLEYSANTCSAALAVYKVWPAALNPCGGTSVTLVGSAFSKGNLTLTVGTGLGASTNVVLSARRNGHVVFEAPPFAPALNGGDLLLPMRVATSADGGSWLPFERNFSSAACPPLSAAIAVPADNVLLACGGSEVVIAGQGFGDGPSAFAHAAISFGEWGVHMKTLSWTTSEIRFQAPPFPARLITFEDPSVITDLTTQLTLYVGGRPVWVSSQLRYDLPLCAEPYVPVDGSDATSGSALAVVLIITLSLLAAVVGFGIYRWKCRPHTASDAEGTGGEHAHGPGHDDHGGLQLQEGGAGQARSPGSSSSAPARKHGALVGDHAISDDQF